MTSLLHGADAIANLQIFGETRKYLWDYLLFSEFSRDSTKKNALFFVFAARKTIQKYENSEAERNGCLFLLMALYDVP